MRNVIVTNKDLYHAFIEQSSKESILFPNQTFLSEYYYEQETYYRRLYSQWLIDKTGLDRLDKRLKEYGMIPADEFGQDYYQSMDMMELDYIYIRSIARIERLDEEQTALLNSAMEGDEEAEAVCMETLIPVSFQKVMAVEPSCPQQWFEIRPTIHGDYRVQGAHCLLGIRCLPDIRNGELFSFEEERKRLNVLKSIKSQLEISMENELGVPFTVFIEPFPV